MSREVDFSSGTVVAPAFLDVIQEMLSGAAVNARLEKVTTTSVRVAAATGNGQASLTINGKFRWITATASLTITGSAGTYGIYAVVATESPVETGGDPVNRGFVLEQNAGTPTGTYRKVGEVDWDGAAITALRNSVGPAPTHNPTFTGTGYIDNPSSSAADTELVTAKWVRDYIASLNIYASGDIKINPSSTLPSGWLYCDGSAISRVTYSALFARIGTTWGVGDGATTFNLPDFRGRLALGLDNMDNSVGTGGGAAGRLTGITSALGNTGGLSRELLDISYIPPHTHAGTITGDGSHTHIATMNKQTVSTYVVFSGSFGYSGTTSGPDAGRNTPDNAGSFVNATAGHTHTYSGSVGVSFAGTFNSAEGALTGNTFAAGSGVSLAPTTHSHGFTGGSINGYGSQAYLSKLPPYALVNWIIKI